MGIGPTDRSPAAASNANGMSRMAAGPTREDSGAGQNERGQGVQITAAAIVPPKGGGAISGLGQRLEPHPFNGSGQFEIPIPTPAPRGVALGLALRYASAGGNGPFGLGFDLEVPKFTRRSTTFGIPRYDATDRFTHSAQGTVVDKLSPDGAIEERVEPRDAPVWRIRAYLPRVEGAFTRIEHWLRLDDGTSHWTIRTTTNETQVYGRSAHARIFDPANPARIAEWLFEESIDARGNKIRYVFAAADAAPGRELTSNRYLAEIACGNFEHAGQDQFNVRVVLDYGGHDGETPPPDPTLPPALRPDPFSSYASGFEVRTIWRCHRILVYAAHPQLFDGTPVLTRSLTLSYTQGYTGLSLLAGVSQRGFRKADDGSDLHEDLPPVTLAFQPFDPLAGRYAALEVENGIIPGAVGDLHFLPLDLDGEGLPGILYNNGGQLLYWPPLGEGRYGAPVAPDRFPSFRDLDGQALTFASLNGNGRKELVSAMPGHAGYFSLEPSGLTGAATASAGWAGFRPFESIPSSYGTDTGTLVALNGDGHLDLVEPQDWVMRAYPSLGTRGFGAPDLAPLANGFPSAHDSGLNQIETYADIFGDGLSHRVRIAQGRVECWPDLGYGRFGDKITLDNAPRYGDVFDAARLFLSDLDGSGPVDLVYATADAVLISFNQGGNGFSAPVMLPLPAPYDLDSKITFTDIYGTGTTCLVFTRLAPDVKHYVYAFAGQAKPYLLSVIDDATGNEARCAYTTSAQEYMRDKRAGRPWITQTYFPVQVISQIDMIDHVAEAHTLRRFAYHDGYYDPILRQFQGFGEVESWESETFARDTAWSGTDPQGSDPQQTGPQETGPQGSGPQETDPHVDHVTPVVYTRTWFHTGAFAEAEAIARHDRADYWRGDPEQPALARQWLAPDIGLADSATLRQAHAALAGQLIRRETYGLADIPEAAVPYSIDQATAGVRLVQPKGHNLNAVVYPFVREHLTARYERDAADPRISHEFTLAQNDYGNTTRRCSVCYPRRPGAEDGPHPLPEQEAISVVLQQRAYVEHPEDPAEPFRWIGQHVELRAYELSDTWPASGLYFDFEELASQCADALTRPVPYGTAFTPGMREARLFQWTRGYYWNADQSAPLQLGQIATQGLAHHYASAIMTPALVAASFGSDAPQAVVEAAGYALDQGYWWNRGLIQYYLDTPTGFYQPCRTDGRFDGVPADGPLNPTTQTRYDEPALHIAAVSQIGSAVDPVSGRTKPVELTSSVVTDHQTGQPASVTDANGTTTQFAYSPLGLLAATAILGMVAEQQAGDLPLDTRTPTPSPATATIAADPAAFLQGSTSYFHHDLLAWVERRQPLAVIEVTRQRHVHQLAPGEAGLLPVSITYRDGSGRDIEKRSSLDAETSGGSARWAVSGRVRRSGTGNPVETYLAYLTASPDYSDHRPIDGQLSPPNVLRYDALDRPILEVTSKGFLRRKAYAAWMQSAWDENDTVLDSPFYLAFPDDPATPAQMREAAALAQAKGAYDTPTRRCFNAAGETVRVLAANLGAVFPDTLAPAVIGHSITAQELWDQLVAEGYLQAALGSSGGAWATARLQPYDHRCQQYFADHYGGAGPAALSILKATSLATQSVLDIAGRTLRLSDPRLFWDSITQDAMAANFDFRLDMAGTALMTISADAGPRAVLQNIFGGDVLRIDGRNTRIVTGYDQFSRPVQVDVTEDATTRRAEIFLYGELHPDPASRNLNGQLWQGLDDAGLITSDLYDLAGNALTPTRHIRPDYTQPADWTTAAIAAVEREDALATTRAFDAGNARIYEQTPDGSILRIAYTLAGQISQVTVQADGETTIRPIVDSIGYDAAGARLRVTYGNGVVTETLYETDTHRLAQVRSTTRAGETLQDVTYTYDPVGNITEVVDSSWATVFCYNQQVQPASTYRYDPLYRLVHATGRQQAGISAQAGPSLPGTMPFCPANPADRQQLETYAETFTYDEGGNMVRLRHSAAHGDWTSDLPVAAQSNRLAEKAYDGNGNQLGLGATPLHWDFRGRLSAAILLHREGQDDDVEHYLYSAAGDRVLRVTRRLKQAARDDEPALYELRRTLFLGDHEQTRTVQECGGTLTPLSSSDVMAVSDGTEHFCVLERDTPQSLARRSAGGGNWRARFQIANEVASVTQEIDAFGLRITYREYCPYGAVAFVAAASDADAATSKFRFSGKRRDDATGLYYFGARYYPPWLARWASPDPAGTGDGLNLYAYVTGNPTTLTDPTGLCGGSKGSAKPLARPDAEPSGTIFTSRNPIGGLTFRAKLVHGNGRITIEDQQPFSKTRRLSGHLDYTQDRETNEITISHFEAKPTRTGLGTLLMYELAIHAATTQAPGIDVTMPALSAMGAYDYFGGRAKNQELYENYKTDLKNNMETDPHKTTHANFVREERDEAVRQEVARALYFDPDLTPQAIDNLRQTTLNQHILAHPATEQDIERVAHLKALSPTLSYDPRKLLQFTSARVFNSWQ